MHNDGVYQNRLPIPCVTDDLTALAELDKKSESKIRLWGCVGLLSFIIGGFLLFLGVMNLVEGGGSWTMSIVGLVIVIAGLIAHFGIVKKARQNEFPDYRYKICQKIIGLISTDMVTHAEIDTKLNLKPQLGTHIIEKGKQGRATWNRQHTTETMMSLSGVFSDGTKFRCSLTEDVKAYGEHFPYRARSGKTKRKLKAFKKLRWTGSLRLRFKEKRYGALPTEPQHWEDLIQLPTGAVLKKLDVNPEEILLVVTTSYFKSKFKAKQTTNIPEAWNAIEPDEEMTNKLSEFIAQLFLNLYQVLNSSKTKKK